MINLKIDTYTRELLQLHYLSGFREISVSRKHFCNKQKKNLAILASDHIGWQHFVFFPLYCKALYLKNMYSEEVRFKNRGT